MTKATVTKVSRIIMTAGCDVSRTHLNRLSFFVKFFFSSLLSRVAYLPYEGPTACRTRLLRKRTLDIPRSYALDLFQKSLCPLPPRPLPSLLPTLSRLRVRSQRAITYRTELSKGFATSSDCDEAVSFRDFSISLSACSVSPAIVRVRR